MNNAAPGLYEREPNRALELTHVSWPRIFHHKGEGLFGKNGFILQPFYKSIFKKMVNQKRYIVFSFSEWRKVYWYNVETIIEIITKITFLYLSSKVPVCCA